MKMLYPQVLLLSIIPQNLSDEIALEELREVKQLLETYGAELADVIIQRREIHDKGSYIGKGKMLEAVVLIINKKIDIVILNAIVKPGQIYEMKKFFMQKKPRIEVWDRIDLILQIFSKHAHTAESKLQIELAAMRHMGPRIYGMGMELSRQTGGIGARGIGETNTELMKRHWREQMKKVKDRLARLSIDRERQLQHRRRAGVQTVSLVGYTNAGKTSLFNTLTGKNKKVENALFVTLDSVVGKVLLPESNTHILLSDTIGFIRNLPTELIDAFRSTLLETVSSDVLIHVVDGSDKNIDAKIKVVDDIVYNMGLSRKKIIYVFNKMDLIPDSNQREILIRYADLSPICISVNTGEGISLLLLTLETLLFEDKKNI